MYKVLQFMGETTNLNWLAGVLNHQQYESYIQVHRLVDASSHDISTLTATNLGEDTVVDPRQQNSEGWGGCSFNYESG